VKNESLSVIGSAAAIEGNSTTAKRALRMKALNIDFTWIDRPIAARGVPDQ
jgi:hypothetical protein